MKRSLFIFSALLCLGLSVWVGAAHSRGEFRLNDWLLGDQERPAVAPHPREGWMAVWQSAGQDGDCYGIYGRLFASGGGPVGPEFRVNEETSGCQSFPGIACNPEGRCIVVWQTWGQDGSGYGIFGRQYDEEGMPLGGEFQINTWTDGHQERPSAAMHIDGSFLVVWQSLGQDGSSYGVYARGFDGTGTPLGEEFPVCLDTEGWQGNPELGIGLDGVAVLVWESEVADGNGFGVVARRFSIDGIPLGPEILINEHLPGDQITPAIEIDGEGTVVIAWSSEDQDGHRFGVYARRFSPELEPLGEEFRANTTTYRDQMKPGVAVAPGGEVAIVWMSAFQDGSGLGVFGQLYLPGGQPWGSEFQVNEETYLYQSFPGAACGDEGLMIVWQSDGQDGDGYGIWARFYGPPERAGRSLRGVASLSPPARSESP